MTFAAAVGAKEEEFEVFFERLKEAVAELKKKIKKESQKAIKEHDVKPDKK